ncbi:MAG TPA: bifunctional (p)ppGpp synthetase/guanosine-3',5'-bis(diphosphate) 3'-pyrophosphohydrolase [Candidatus Desulfobacillus sp.]|nr:bifunctional (p)ppGpp synthetase/guanosine-3',5'-bis(diphosphate) 3'-pyrophosphohydrolase [Candidatus Desulfobacillus sp.]
MVSVTHSLARDGAAEAPLDLLAEGLPAPAREPIAQACEYARGLYGEGALGSGEPAWPHALGMALVVASLRLDLDARLAALLFAAPDFDTAAGEAIAARFGAAVAELVEGQRRLKGLQQVMRQGRQAREGAQSARAQAEVLRKMLLAMSADIRVVLLRLASRVQTLRFLAGRPQEERAEIARESLDIYAPLANRIGIWQLKWEIEDLAFRFLEPETYKRIAGMLDERRAERAAFIEEAVARLRAELAAAGVEAEVSGRPKHIYSIYAKMKAKGLGFDEVYDVRALRVLVDTVRDCYAALGVVHHIWQPIPQEFDDYISRPKGNDYRSLHTAVIGPGGRTLEVQIRTREMHRHAELGVAAHWRYKEKSGADARYDDKIAWLRQLLSWRDEIGDSSEWVRQFRRAALDDTIYVLTPQGRVIDLPRGATPVDFAYRLHTELGHRCRGAKVDGALVPLNTPLQNGQTVEIVAARQGGPSRDWLQPGQGYLATPRARAKARQWFAAQDEAETLAQGRAGVARELQREGQGGVNLEELARKLGFASADALYLAFARGEAGPRQLQAALREAPPAAAPEPEALTRRSRAQDAAGRVLIVGVDRLLTQLGRCCKPVPPDAIAGFVTRGKGVSVHRLDCPGFRSMSARNPERVISAEWGGGTGALYPVDILVEAQDRQGLLRDISEVLSREKINVTAARTRSRQGAARMDFTLEVDGAAQLQRALKLIGAIAGVERAGRR